MRSRRAKAEASALLDSAVAIHGGNRDSLWSVQPRPGWVRFTRWKAESGDDAPVAFSDLQVSFVGPRPKRYHRIIYRNRTKAELEGHRLVRIDLLPPHQQLEVHAIKIHRGKRVIDEINPFMVGFAPEVPKTVEHRLFGPPQTYVAHEPALIIRSDLEIGDLLEIEYTRTGVGDPRLEVRSSVSVAIPAVLEAADLQLFRVIADPDEPPLELRRHATALEPQQRRRRGGIEYFWQVKDTPPPPPPPEHGDMPTIEFSNFGDWETVAALHRPLYDLDDASTGTSSDPTLQALAREIMKKHAGQSARVSAALDHVQHNIAFSSANLGKWTSEPRPVADTLRRGVGDCKGKALVLRDLLRELGVASELVLVNLKGADLREVMPSPAKLNHVIVAIRIDDREVFVDPTQQGDRGEPSSLPLLSFRMGLSLTPGRGVVDIPHPCDDPEPMFATTLNYAMSAPGQPVRIVLGRTIRQVTLATFEADFKKSFGELSTDEVGQFLTGRLGIPHQLGELRRREDAQHGSVFLEANMVVHQIWRKDDDGGPVARLGPSYMDQDLSQIVSDRHLRQRDWSDFHRVDTQIDLPFEMKVNSETFDFKLPGFRVTHDVAVDGRQIIARSDVRLCSRLATDPDAILAALPDLIRRMRIELRPLQPWK